MIPPAELTTRIESEAELVRAWLPWLPFIGAQELKEVGWLYYRWNNESQSPFMAFPPKWNPTDVQLRQSVRHEMGHYWADEIGRRMDNSFDVYKELNVPFDHLQRSEIVAEIFARAMGNPPLYVDLEPLSRPSDLAINGQPRAEWIERAAVPDVTAEQVELDLRINAFWNRSDIPEWFKQWAPNFQQWQEIYVRRPARLK